MADTKKAKRSLKNISFEHDGAHVALTAKSQGGPANSHDYALVLKSASEEDKQVIEKIQQVQVTLELPEFLRRFFSVYYEDAEVLARMMGYVEPEEEADMAEMSYSDYCEMKLEERLASYTIIKSMEDQTKALEVLAELSPQQHLQLKLDQQSIEKVLEGAAEAIAKAKETVNKKAEEAPSGGKSKKVNKSMDEIVELQKSLDSAKAELTKALADLEASKTELTKALDELNVLKTEKAEAVSKARFEILKAAVKDEAKAETLFKSLKLIESSEEFEAVVKTLGEMTATIEKSNLFDEQGAGASSASNQDTKSSVQKALDKQYKKS